jgi:hypothetical protein
MRRRLEQSTQNHLLWKGASYAVHSCVAPDPKGELLMDLTKLPTALVGSTEATAKICRIIPMRMVCRIITTEGDFMTSITTPTLLAKHLEIVRHMGVRYLYNSACRVHLPSGY